MVLIAVDIIFIPRFSYWACAWAGFISYGVSMVLSYFFGQKYYPIRYPLGEITRYVVLAAVLFAAISVSNAWLPTVGALAVNTLIIAVFAAVIVKRDLPLGSLIGKVRRR